MASKSSKSKTSAKNEKVDYHTRQVRRTRIIFGVIAVILVLSMALSMVVNF
jgi:predicted nucleic acid-binding Zn ribbon protein